MKQRVAWSSAHVCDWTVGCFAVWTVVTNLTALTRGGLPRLLVSFAVVVILALLYWWRRKRNPSCQTVAPEIIQKEVSPNNDLTQSIIFWIVMGLAVCLTLIAHRPDRDDAHYVNWAVAAVDAPQAPILSVSPMSAPPQPAMLPAYKMHSFEMLGAMCAWLTHTPVIVWFHLIFAPLAALLSILAYRNLFSLLVPKQYAYGLLAVFIFLCANGNVHASYGNVSFVRLHQGKGIFLSAILPLIIAYGMRFAMQPTKRNWLLLMSAQITAIGTTSTALWVAPSVAAFALVAGLPKLSFPAQAKRLTLGLTASVYLVAIGLYIRLAYPMPERGFSTQLTSMQLLDRSLEYVYGYNRFALACLFIILTAWIFCETRLVRRLCLVFPLGVGLFFANPLVASALATKLTGVSTYWRVFWVLPMPTIAALFFLVPLTTTKLRCPLPIRTGVYILLLVLCWTWLPEKYTISASNNTRLGFPRLKVPETYQIAQQLTDLFDESSNVLAPEAVTAWLNTIHHHPYPLLGREMYAVTYGEEGQRRLTLKRYITGTGRPEQAQQVLREGLQNYQIRAVCFPVANPWGEEIREILKEARFTLFKTIQNYEIWVL